MQNETAHISVMRDEVVEFLCFNGPGEYLDCTLGGGGHTAAILAKNSANKVVACDRDERALKRAAIRLSSDTDRLTLEHLAFSELKDKFKDSKFHGMLADLGISTDQLVEDRGFSFKDDVALDMRMDESRGPTAGDIINQLEERDLYIMFREGGMGPEAKSLAKAIVRERPIASTKVLAELVSKALHGKYRDKKGHPATVAFQAIRMRVNNESSEISALLEAAPRLVRSGGRFVVITFHSIEDKLVTHAMRHWESGGEFSALVPGSMRGKSLGKMIGKRAIEPKEDEVERNPSSRSAKLRVFEFN